MGYKLMTVEIIYDIFRRNHAGQNIAQISQVVSLDRKTVREYLTRLEQMGFDRDKAFPSGKELRTACEKLVEQKNKKKSKSSKLAEYEQELRDLIGDVREPVKPKTAFRIIKSKHNLDVSYETFKRFSREKKLSKAKPETMIRIELPPGREVQMDYGKVGTLFDPVSKKNRAIHAFAGILSYSRKPFFQFVFKQDQQSFVNSFIDMFEFYGGVVQSISIDNLKTGVIQPDLYDPRINKSFNEMVEYYGAFVDPCRVRKPTDKGTIERTIPVVRELFRELKCLNEGATIEKLNQLALKWCQDEYGNRPHGTTKVAPNAAFAQVEKNTLKALPLERFVVPKWHGAKVHPDQFLQFDKKLYSLPASYRGKQVWVRNVGPLVEIYYQYSLIRQYTVPRGHRAYIKEDFPEVIREMMDGSYPKYLLEQARVFGTGPAQLIESILIPHAYLNARCAQGIINILKQNRKETHLDDICLRARHAGISHPQRFRKFLEAEKKQLYLEMEVPRSDHGNSMIREAAYYTG